MSQDNKRVEELQSALRTKMADNKAIADSFKIEEGTVVVSAEQKSAFDKNMVDIKEIKGLISGLSTMDEVDQWASQPQDSVASTYASAAASVQQLSSREIKTIGEMFLDSPEFKSLANGRNGYNMSSPWQVQTALTQHNYGVKDVFSAMPAVGTIARGSGLGDFGTIQRDPMVSPPMRSKRVRDLFPVRTTNASVIEYFRQVGFTSVSGAPTNNAASK